MAYWRGCLDFRGLGAELRDIYSAPTKKVASAEARARGWRQTDIQKAATRFNVFWVLGQWVEYGQTFRCAAQMPHETVLLTLKH